MSCWCSFGQGQIDTGKLFFFLFESRRKSSQEPFYKLLENAHYFWKVLFQLKRLVKPHLIFADSIRLHSDFK